MSHQPIASISWLYGNPEWKLTMLVEPAIAAGQELKLYATDPAHQRELMQKAIESYQQICKIDAATIQQLEDKLKEFEWIDCEVIMPIQDTEVLVSYLPLGSSQPIVIGAVRDKLFSDSDTLFWFNSKGEAMRGVITHWMPMINTPRAKS